jgi:hypothetical protein
MDGDIARVNASLLSGLSCQPSSVAPFARSLAALERYIEVCSDRALEARIARLQEMSAPTEALARLCDEFCTLCEKFHAAERNDRLGSTAERRQQARDRRIEKRLRKLEDSIGAFPVRTVADIRCLARAAQATKPWVEDCTGFPGENLVWQIVAALCAL